MPGFRFLHAADLHIDSPLRGLERYEGAPVEEIRTATRRALDNLVTTAIAEKVAFVVFAGDLFDGDWKDFGTGLFFAQRLRRLGEAGIAVYLLAGNHDAASHMTKQIEWPDNVTVFPTAQPRSVTHAPTGAVLHGQGFATRAVEADLAAAYPRAVAGAFNIGVLHTALEGRAGHDTYAPCTVATLRGKGYDYWALGHVHAREVVSEEPWIVFPGNLQGRHVREAGSKGATMVEVDDGRIASIEHRAFDVVRFAQVDVDAGGAKTRMAVLDAARRALTRAREDAEGRLLVARVSLSGRTEADHVLRRGHDELVAQLRDAANAVGELWIESLRIATTPAMAGAGKDLVEALALDHPDTMRGVIAGLHDGVGALLDSTLEPDEDRDALLQALFAEARDLAMDRLLDAAAAEPKGDGA